MAAYNKFEAVRACGPPLSVLWTQWKWLNQVRMTASGATRLEVATSPPRTADAVYASVSDSPRRRSQLSDAFRSTAHTFLRKSRIRTLT